MKILPMSLAFIAAISGLGAAPSYAVAVATYTGTLASGRSSSGVDLAGKNFSLQLSFFMDPTDFVDDRLNRIGGQNQGLLYSVQAQNFLGFSFAPQTRLIIDGESSFIPFSAFGNYLFSTQTRVDSGFSSVIDYTDDTGGTNDAFERLNISAHFGNGLNDFFSDLPLRNVSDVSGNFRIYTQFSLKPGDGVLAFGTFAGPGTFSFAGDTGVSMFQIVPEPSSWLMLTVGFGIVGGITRRKGTAGPCLATLH